VSGLKTPSEVVVCLLGLGALLILVHRSERPDPKWQLYSSILENARESGFEHDSKSSNVA
jgi:hypothetical protein